MRGKLPGTAQRKAWSKVTGNTDWGWTMYGAIQTGVEKRRGHKPDERGK